MTSVVRLALSSEDLEKGGLGLVKRPDKGDLRFNYGAVLASLGRHDEALRQIEAAESLGYRGPAVVVAKAKVLARLGRLVEARAVLEAGVRNHPDHPEIRELLQALD